MAIRKPIVVVTENHLSELPAGDSLMAHLDPDTTTLPELIEALIASITAAGPEANRPPHIWLLAFFSLMVITGLPKD